LASPLKMPSSALLDLLAGIEEVRNLQLANPAPPGGLSARSSVVRAINRSSVVLLTSHFERYLRGLNEEAVDAVNASPIVGSALPEALRLQHSRPAVDGMFETKWTNRGTRLQAFARQDSWLWSAADKGNMEAERLVRWMRTPSPEQVGRLFKMWGVDDVFGKVTRAPHQRARFWTRIGELIEKRNRIAHGDRTAEATFQDVSSYLAVVRDFCSRADRIMARAVSRVVRTAAPW
jgi:hypothetical protein